MKKNILILGGSSDIGLIVIKKFLSNNWSVISHCNSNSLELIKLKNKFPNKMIILKCNFGKVNELNIFLRKIKKFHISSFVNLVGYNDNISFEKTNLLSLLKAVQINSIIPIMVQKIILKKMKSNKFGRLLQISSIGVKFGGGTNTFNYSFSKHTLEFIPSHIRKLVKYNILSNILRVGVVKTKFHKNIKGKKLSERIKLIPIGRSADKGEIANMIFYLSSEKNTYISNEKITIAGGE